jgi:branched-chain amino acid transport system substrate-binding protein
MAPDHGAAGDHGGGGKARIEMWDGGKWVPQTDWLSAYQHEVWKIVERTIG